MDERRVDLDEIEHAEQQRMVALYALVMRAGGHVIIRPEEMPVAPYSLMRRWTPEGGMEIRIVHDERAS